MKPVLTALSVLLIGRKEGVMDERTTDVPSYRGRISSVGRELTSGRSRVRFPGPDQYSGS